MTTIAISINGKEIIIISPCSLNQALDDWSTRITGAHSDSCNEATLESSVQSVIKSDMKCYVIALNQIFVPRNHYDRTRLTSGDSIELLSPMAGG
ncbi:MAG: thiamine biosynthesis protein ThiS [Oleispira sp.]|jgi:thiamine biosynthesis protein ThiS